MSLAQLTPEEFTYQEYNQLTKQESSLISQLGIKIDLSHIDSMTMDEMEEIINVVFNFLTVDTRQKDV